MAHGLESTRPVMGTGARFHGNEGRWKLSDGGRQTVSPDFVIEKHLARLIDGTNLENILC
jgi:hypothetical protein